MPVIDSRNTLSGIMVSEAMRRLVVQLSAAAPIEHALRSAVKFKVNAILIVDESQKAVGVVSKTDLMGAYYAELPLDSPLASLMVGPPIFCRPDDTLESALEAMRSARVHRLYVEGDERGEVLGVLAYPDVVGLLYRFCSKCDRSASTSGGSRSGRPPADRFRVGEVMTAGAKSLLETTPIGEVLEGLSEHRLGAFLITGADGGASGVVSKSDLIIAYKHGVPRTAAARTIMTSPVNTCEWESPLAEAIRKMIFLDIHRLFVSRDDPGNVVGVLSLTDAARVRSGSCRACTTSRIESRLNRNS